MSYGYFYKNLILDKKQFLWIFYKIFDLDIIQFAHLSLFNRYFFI